MTKNGDQSVSLVMRFATVIFCLILGLYFAYKYAAADPAGFCRSQNRYLSDNEFIGIAVRLLEEDMAKTVTITEKYGTTVKSKKDYYYSHWDFNKRNLNCCRVDRTEAESGFNRIIERQRIIVWLNPKTSTWPIERQGDVLAALYFDVCGKLVPSDLALFY